MGQSEPELFLDDHRGIYIPRDFSEAIDPRCWFGVTSEELGILGDPQHDLYWEVWSEVCDGAVAFIPSDASRYLAATIVAMDAAHTADSAGDTAERDRILATLTGERWSLYQDGALWLIPDGMEWSDEQEWYVWPDASAEAE